MELRAQRTQSQWNANGPRDIGERRGQSPPCAWYQFSVNRKGEHPVSHLSGYKGVVHAGGYTGFNGNGQLELDNNICGRSIRPVTLDRKNYLFMGSKGGGEASAIACTLIECDAVSRTYPPMYDISIFSTAGRSPRVIALLNSEYRSPLARQIWAMAVEISSSEHPPRINARRSWPPVANRHV